MRTQSLRKHSDVCAITGQELAKHDMLRLVTGPDGARVLDIKESLPGEAIWVIADKALLKKAASEGKLALDDASIEHMEGQLKKYCLNLLGVAKKANGLRSGITNVQERMKKHKAAALIIDNESEYTRKDDLRHAFGATEIIDVFNAAELKSALSNANSVHVLEVENAITEKILSHVARLKQFIG